MNTKTLRNKKPREPRESNIRFVKAEIPLATSMSHPDIVTLRLC